MEVNENKISSFLLLYLIDLVEKDSDEEDDDEEEEDNENGGK